MEGEITVSFFQLSFHSNFKIISFGILVLQFMTFEQNCFWKSSLRKTLSYNYTNFHPFTVNAQNMCSFELVYGVNGYSERAKSFHAGVQSYESSFKYKY